MDISMPGMNGLVATRTLKRAQPDVAIVALTRHDDETYLEELLRAGASGYVLKQSSPDGVPAGHPSRGCRRHIPRPCDDLASCRRIARRDMRRSPASLVRRSANGNRKCCG